MNRRLATVRITILPKLIYTFNLTPVRNTVGLFVVVVETDWLILKFM